MNYGVAIALVSYFNEYHDAIVSVPTDRDPLLVIKDLCEVYKHYTQVTIGKVTYHLPNNKMYIYDSNGKIENMYMLRLQAHEFFMEHWRNQFARKFKC